jgi:GT2 family glycosyltransferase
VASGPGRYDAGARRAAVAAAVTEREVKFTVLVPLYRTQPDHFDAMVRSVLAQTEPSLELVVVDDGSEDDQLTALLARVSAADPRVRVVVLDHNQGISVASAAGLAAARGDYIALLDHDDLLDPRALEVVREALERFPDADILYTDEDQLHEDGSFQAAFHKPAYSPERLRGQNYFGHLSVFRRGLLNDIGGFRPGFDGSQDYDLVLRATERARQIVHIPEVVYHWRIHDASVSHRSENAPVFDAAHRALAEHLDRIGVDAEVEQVHNAGVYRIKRTLHETPPVTIVIPTRGSRSVVRGVDRVLVVEAVATLLEKTTYPDFDILIVADAPTPVEVREALVALAPDRVRVLPYPFPFNYSDKINYGVIRARADLLLLLNDDTEILNGDWLETMVALLAPDVGMVGAKLLYEDGTIQHLGLHVGKGDVMHIAEGEPADDVGPFAAHLLDRETSGVTGACALVPRHVFEEVGGLSLSLPVNFNDVDFGFKILDAGYRILVTPHAVLHHFESRTRHRRALATEIELFRGRWAHRLATDDFWREKVLARGATAGVPAVQRSGPLTSPPTG